MNLCSKIYLSVPMTEGFLSTSEDTGNTDIGEPSESSSSLAADTLIDSSDNEDGIEKKPVTSLTSTTSPKLTLKRESSVCSALEFAKHHQDSDIGLLKYFSQGTKEDVDVYWKREEE